MAIAARLDDPDVRDRLASWLAGQIGTPRVELSGFDAPALSGYSNETLLADAAWTNGAGERITRGIAVRMEPAKHQVFPDTMFDTQVRVMRALSATVVPVPEILWFEPDPKVLGSPFFVMGRLDGRAAPDNPPYHVSGWLQEASPELRARIWWNGVDAMASIHRLDPQWAGVTFLDVVDAKEQLRRDHAYADWALEGRPYPLLDQAFEILEAKVPSRDVRPALVWGDSRIGNILFDAAGNVQAVVDWEMVSLGDPVADLAWFLLLDRHHSDACDVPRLAGFPSREETIARWEAKTGYDAGDLDWWELLGAVRYAAILTRVLDLLDDSGAMPGAREFMSLENTSTKLLRLYLDDARV
jgi:aminoglycoside phosphotransferase (APT) family kinase protein